MNEERDLPTGMTVKIRRGKKEEERKKEERNRMNI